MSTSGIKLDPTLVTGALTEAAPDIVNQFLGTQLSEAIGAEQTRAQDAEQGLRDLSDPAFAAELTSTFAALDGITRTYAPRAGATNGWEAVWDSPTGYLQHHRTGPSTTGTNAVIAIGTDKGSGNGFLGSHKNGASMFQVTTNPGSGLGYYGISYGVNPPIFLDLYVGAGPQVAKYKAGAGFKDGASTEGSTTFTSATAAFTAGDVGQTIVQLTSRALDDPFGCIPDGTTIAAVVDAQTVTMSQPATATGTGVLFRVGGRAVNPSQRVYEVRDSDDSTLFALSKGSHFQFKPADATAPSWIVKGKAAQAGDIFQVVNNNPGNVALRASESGAGGDMSGSFSNASLQTRNAFQVINWSTTTDALRIKRATTSLTGNLISLVDDNDASLFSILGDGRPKWSAAALSQTTVGNLGGASPLPAAPMVYLRAVGPGGTPGLIPFYAES